MTAAAMASSRPAAAQSAQKSCSSASSESPARPRLMIAAEMRSISVSFMTLLFAEHLQPARRFACHVLGRRAAEAHARGYRILDGQHLIDIGGDLVVDAVHVGKAQGGEIAVLFLGEC